MLKRAWQFLRLMISRKKRAQRLKELERLIGEFEKERDAARLIFVNAFYGTVMDKWIWKEGVR